MTDRSAELRLVPDPGEEVADRLERPTVVEEGADVAAEAEITADEGIEGRALARRDRLRRLPVARQADVRLAVRVDLDGQRAVIDRQPPCGPAEHDLIDRESDGRQRIVLGTWSSTGGGIECVQPVVGQELHARMVARRSRRLRIVVAGLVDVLASSLWPMMRPTSPALAPRGRRVGARVVDLVVAGWVLTIAAIEVDGRLLGGDVFAQRPLSAVTPDGTRLVVIATLVVLLLEIVPTAFWGRTPGKAMLGLRCIDVDTGGSPGVVRSVFRGLLLHAWVAIPIVGWVLPAAITITTVAAPSGRGMHDRLAGTLVVDASPGPTVAGGVG